MRSAQIVIFLVWTLSAGEVLAQPDAGTLPVAAARGVEGEVRLEQDFAVLVNGQRVASDPNAAQTSPVTVGTALVLTLDVRRPVDTSLALPSEQDTGRFELVKVERAPVAPEPGAAAVRELIELHFAVFRPGRHVLEAFELKVMDAQGGISTVSTRPVNLRVVSVIANDKNPEMPSAQRPVSVWTEDWALVWIGGVLLSLLVAGLLGAWLYRAFGPKPPPPPPPPPRPAHEIAMEKLGAIAAANLPEQGEFEAFYVRVSEAVREYLGRRYNLSITDQAGLELTTEELLVPLREVRWPRGMDHFLVESLLHDCDIVKFARYSPSEDEAAEVLMRAFQLVELTRGVTLGEDALGSVSEERDGGATSPPQREAHSAGEGSEIVGPAEGAQVQASNEAEEGDDV